MAFKGEEKKGRGFLYPHLPFIQYHLAVELDDRIFKDGIDVIGGQDFPANGVAASNAAVSIAQASQILQVGGAKPAAGVEPDPELGIVISLPIPQILHDLAELGCRPTRNRGNRIDIFFTC